MEIETLIPFILAVLFAVFMTLQKNKKGAPDENVEYDQDDNSEDGEEFQEPPKESYFTFEEEVKLKRIEFENRQSLESELGEDMLSRMRDEAVAEQLIRDEQGSAVKVHEPIDFDARRAVIYSEILKRKF